MTFPPDHRCRLLFVQPSEPQDLTLVRTGIEVGMICERIGIAATRINLDMTYYAGRRLKTTDELIHSIVELYFETPEDAAAFRLAAPSKYFVDESEIY